MVIFVIQYYGYFCNTVLWLLSCNTVLWLFLYTTTKKIKILTKYEFIFNVFDVHLKVYVAMTNMIFFFGISFSKIII